MSSKLPPKNDPERDAQEKKAIKARDKTEKAVEAIKGGQLPSTGQITQTIDRIQESEALHSAGQGITPLGKRVLADTEKLLESTKRVLDEKNANDEIQNIIYHGTQGTKDISGDTKNVTGQIKQKVQSQTSTARQETSSTAQEAYQKILKIPTLVMSNTEFRLLLNEINSIIQDAINVNNPNQRINQNDNQRINRNDDQSEIYEDSQEFPSQYTTISTDTSDPNQTKQEVQQIANETADNTKQQLRQSTYPVAKTAAKIGGEHIKDFSEGKKSLRDATTDSAKSLKSTVQDNITAYKLSDEQRDRLVTRFKNVMIQTHQNPEFQDTIDELMNLISQLSHHTKQLTEQVSESLTGTQQNLNQNDSLQIATQNAKSLIESFANNRSLNPLINSIKEFGIQIQKDQDLRNYFEELREYIHRSLYDTEFIENSDYINHGSRLIKSGRDLLLEKYRVLTQDIQKEVSAFNEAIQSDTTTIRWVQDFDRLVSDIFLDEHGRPTIKFELVKDISKILAVVTQKFQYLPLPKMENSDDQYDYTFDNIVLHLPEILPKHLHVSLTSDINLDREENSVLQNYASFEISKIRGDARNIQFYYKKKKGMINMTDAGQIDFAIPDNGIQFNMKLLLETPTNDHPYLRFNVLEADTKIDNLKFRLHETKHDLLYSLLTPLAETRVKRQLETVITEKMRAAIEFLQENLKRVQGQFSKLKNNVNLGSVAGTINSNINNITGTIKNKTNHPIIHKATDKVRDNTTSTTDNIARKFNNNNNNDNNNNNITSYDNNNNDVYNNNNNNITSYDNNNNDVYNNNNNNNKSKEDWEVPTGNVSQQPHTTPFTNTQGDVPLPNAPTHDNYYGAKTTGTGKIPSTTTTTQSHPIEE